MAFRMKYSHPRILLVDIKDGSHQALQQEGYHVLSGTFGSPYRVPKGHDYLPVITEGNLPEYEQQQVVVVDLVPGKAKSGAPEGSRKPSRGVDWWANLHKGIIDPRSKMMVSVRKESDAILSRGGVFIIFADAREQRDMKWGHMNEEGKFIPIGDITYTNWDFLSLLSSRNLETRPDYGHEITVGAEQYPLLKILSDHAEEVEVLCSLHPTHEIDPESWSTLATNPAGNPVAITWAVSPKNQKLGWVFIFPQIRDKTAFLLRALREVLPELNPALFSGE